MRAWILSSLLLMGTHLFGETFANVEWEFPPSNFEWRPLVEKNLCNTPGFGDDEAPFRSFKVFTHREGDALEIFFLCAIDASDDDDELEVLEECQKEVDGLFNVFFPNHKMHLISLNDEPREASCEWELGDEKHDLMHGMTRIFKHQANEALKVYTLFGYCTTALRTEQNAALWRTTLNQARLLSQEQRDAS